MTPNEKDRETAGSILHEWEIRYCSPYGVSHPAISMEQRAGLKILIALALHSTRISALKEAVEVLKPLFDCAGNEIRITTGNVDQVFYKFIPSATFYSVQDELTKTMKELEK